MRKILFLDIDGVLNNRESMMRTDVSIFRVHPTCAHRLWRLIVEDGVELVLSSTWRFGGVGYEPGPRLAMDAIHDAIGQYVRFLGFTPRDLDERGDECNIWIKRHGRTGDVYVAVDDDGDFSRFVGTLVKTDPEPGLTDDNVEAIREAFKKGGAE